MGAPMRTRSLPRSSNTARWPSASMRGRCSSTQRVSQSLRRVSATPNNWTTAWRLSAPVWIAAPSTGPSATVGAQHGRARLLPHHSRHWCLRPQHDGGDGQHGGDLDYGASFGLSNAWGVVRSRPLEGAKKYNFDVMIS